MINSDYHTHTNFSDGILTPTALVDAAAEEGIQTLALTDHDTMDGISEFLQAARAKNIRAVAGMEVSSVWRYTNVHILAYWQDYENLDLNVKSKITNFIDEQKQSRLQRAHKIAEVLNNAGYKVDFEEVVKMAKPSVPTRPHFAYYMIEQGYFKRYGEAFYKILGKGKAADINIMWRTMPEIVAELYDLGAKTSIAHPFAYKFSSSVRRTLFKEFLQAGGDAVEIINAKQDTGQVQACINDCNKLGLKMTWGSDFHNPSFTKLGAINWLGRGLNPLFKAEE